MKTIKLNFAIVIPVLLMLLAGCSRDTISPNYTVIDGEKVKILNAFSLSKAYNDTLIMVYDTALIHHGNHYCIKYDKLYHKGDSMFTAHYTLMGDEMYKNGMMMQHYSPSYNVMHGGMMKNGMMDMSRMMSDTTIVDGYYRNMHQLHIKHATYHNGIYSY